MKNVIAAALLFSTSAVLSTPATAAGTSAGYGMGGQFSRFDPVVSQYNQSGELFRIQGHCQSACTLFLSIRNVCIERSATLLFHAGHDKARNVTSFGTNHMLGAYNAALRDYVSANHYMDTLEFHAISGRDMIQKFGYKECPK
jgi:predicted amidophosphoribosyltransferase